MKEDSLSTKEMLLNIGSMRTMAMPFTTNGKAYNSLLANILAEDFYYDEETHVPSLKELVERTGLSSGKVRKYIEEIYYDLVLNWETKPTFSITKVRYKVVIRNHRNKWYTFELDQLPVIPRVGEEFAMPFFTAHLGNAYYYVDDIRHKLEENVQTVEIWLKYGSYNLYWHYRRDKAKEEGELGFNDDFEKSDLELKRELKVGRWGRR